MLSIKINGETREIPQEFYLDRVLDHFSLPSDRVAVELNRSVVRRADWPETTVRDGDTIEVVHFVGGG